MHIKSNCEILWVSMAHFIYVNQKHWKFILTLLCLNKVFKSLSSTFTMNDQLEAWTVNEVVVSRWSKAQLSCWQKCINTGWACCQQKRSLCKLLSALKTKLLKVLLFAYKFFMIVAWLKEVCGLKRPWVISCKI